MEKKSVDLEQYLDVAKPHSIGEMRKILDRLREAFEIVRIVDSDECRVLHLTEDNRIRYGEACYDVWGTNIRCSHCTSFRANRLNRELSRSEEINGKPYHIRSVPIRLTMEDGDQFHCMLELINPELDNDVSLEQNANDLNYMMFHDVLTGTLNEDGLLRAIRRALEDHPTKAYFLVLTDVSRFRQINELFGRQSGDDVLSGVAELLTSYEGKEQIVGRLREDQFVLFVPAENFSSESLMEVLLVAQQKLDLPYYRMFIRAAIYPVLKREQQLPVSVMIERARIALETIRDDFGEHIVVFTDDMLDGELKEQNIVRMFRHGLDDGEFHIRLQPRVQSGERVIGAEAVVRWEREDGSVLNAEEFIPVLEKTDLALRLDRYIWESAAKTLASWKGTKLERCFISVNISANDIYYMNLAGELSEICRKYNIPCKALHPVFHQANVAAGTERYAAVVDELHDAGFSVEIDDFGQESSEMSVFRNVDADVVKIDMAFIRGMERGSRRNIILESIIDLARRLGMLVVTTGVETAGEAQMLELMGCVCYQGNYFSEPLPVPEFEAYFNNMNRPSYVMDL